MTQPIRWHFRTSTAQCAGCVSERTGSQAHSPFLTGFGGSPPRLAGSRIAGRKRAGRVSGSDCWKGGPLIACLGHNINLISICCFIRSKRLAPKECFRNGLTLATPDGGYHTTRAGAVISCQSQCVDVCMHGMCLGRCTLRINRGAELGFSIIWAGGGPAVLSFLLNST